MPRTFRFSAVVAAIVVAAGCKGSSDLRPPGEGPPVYPPPGDYNSQPWVSGVTLAPGAPVTTDDLVATASVYDQDGDAITLSYAWHRNGAAIPGQARATLPASETTKGDLIAVTVTASDGQGSGTGTASVTILDAPPVLASSAPAQVTHGEPVTFTVAGSDPDGEPVGALVLVYGPAGMTIAGDAVSWTPTLPMFDAALDVHFGVASAAQPTVAMRGTLHVVDPGRAYALRRFGFDLASSRNGLRAGDLDGDGDEDLLVASRRGVFELSAADGAYVQAWAYPFAEGGQTANAVAAHDVDGDGRREIFLSQGNVILMLDGVSRREVARVEVSASSPYYSTPNACTDLEVADVDADGAPEVVCLRPASSYSYETTAKLVVLDAATLALRWETAAASLGSDLVVGQLDGDAALEIATSGGYVFDGESAATDWAYAPGFGTAVDAGDLDGDGVEEIVGSASSNIVGYSALYRSPLWEASISSYYAASALLVADVDGDGTPEIVAGTTSSWDPVTAYRYRPATNDLVAAFQLGTADGGVMALAAGDLDGDGAREIAWSAASVTYGEDALVVLGRDGTGAWGAEWASGAPGRLDGPFVGAPLAALGGGAARLLFACATTNSGYDGTRLVSLDPGTGLLSVSGELGTNWNGWAALAAADLDADGVDEAFLSTATYGGYFTIYDPVSATAQWTSPANSGSGRAVAAADLTGDGVADLVAITSEGNVQIWNGSAGALAWKSVTIGGTGMDLAVADLDGDGVAEIVALTSTRLVVYRYDADAPVPWLEHAAASVSGMDLEVVVQDGVPELDVLVGSYGTGTTLQRFDASATLLGQVILPAPATALHVEELGYGRKNLLVSTGPTYGYDQTTPGRLRAIDPATGAEIWASPPLFGVPAPNSVRYVDPDGDGEPALAIGTAASMYLTR